MMTTTLNAAAAAEHRSDLLRAARASVHAASDQPAVEQAITLRLAGPADADALLALEQLDGAGALREPVLVAASGTQIVAALSLADGAVTADPFRPTANAIALLRVRAARERARRRLRWRLRLA